MGCFLVMMVVSGSRNPQLTWSKTSTADWLAAVASNQGYAAYAAAGFHSEQNSVQDPIEWTNRSRSSGEVGSIQPAKTNSLNY